MQEIEIEDRIHVGVSDNAGNMGAAMRVGNIQSFGCVSHSLQLVIKDAINKSDMRKSLKNKCRKIVANFIKSEKASRYFKQIQEDCGAVHHKLLQDINTRWNSTYIMMERLLEQRTAVTLYAVQQGGIPLLVAKDWGNITALISLLESFYEATLDMSMKYQAKTLLRKKWNYISKNR